MMTPTKPRRVQFHVNGHPMPNPKLRKHTGTAKGGIAKRDDSGRAKAWASHVRLQANVAMGGVPFKGAVRLGVHVRKMRPKNNQTKHPTGTPDWSNYYYFIENILQGCAYENDSQVIGPLPGDKSWVDEDWREGVTITIEEV